VSGSDGLTAPDDVAAMRLALEEAGRAGLAGEVPVGAVVVIDGLVVARAGNERERRGDPTAHAEMIALRAAAASTGSWRLHGATLVVTLEPCVMCAGALLSARVARVVFGAANPEAGSCGSLYNVCADPRLNHETEVVAGLLADDSAELLRSFFTERRGRERIPPW
jgi:tRNA(adenine34) deaminase